MGGESERGTLEVEDRRGVALIRLFAEHDLATAPGLREQIEARVAAGDGVVVSLMDATFIDSAATRVLFNGDRLLRAQGRRLVLHVATASIVRRVLDVSGLSVEMRCTGSLEEALRLAAAREDAS
jgi:anti-anti-sigma factor